LTSQHKFEPFELVTFTRALRWFDRADALCSAADRAAEAREGAALLKQAMDASTTALRFWRQLKFTDGTATRRPGRPSGDNWSLQRKLQAAKAV
jgi:hypothetical protein